MGINNIITDRLIIIPMTYSIVSSILSGNNKEIEKLGVNLNGKWPLQDTLDILLFTKDNMKKNDEVSGFEVWMVVKKEDMTVIGDAGFKGEPDENGEIEIGFGLIKEEQRKGYGYEVASSLIKWASQKDIVKDIKADCLIDNIGSIKILKKCGMCEIKRDNELIYWKKNVE
jgi:RimJ/RimL family protein N-acetyltransferase